MAACIVGGCSYNSRKRGIKEYSNISLHRVPTSSGKIHVVQKWIEFIRAIRGHDWMPKKSPKLCSQHFAPDCFSYHLSRKHRKMLKANAVPTIMPSKFKSPRINGPRGIPARIPAKVTSGPSAHTVQKEQIAPTSSLNYEMDPIAIEESKPLVCRGCLSTERSLQPLGRALATLYDQLVGTDGLQADAYPRWVCSYCRALLLKFIMFRNKCRSSQYNFHRVAAAGIPVTLDLLKSVTEVPYPNLKQTLVQSINLGSPDHDPSLVVPVKIENGNDLMILSPLIMDGNDHEKLSSLILEDGNDRDMSSLSTMEGSNDNQTLSALNMEDVSDVKIEDGNNEMLGPQVPKVNKMPKELLDHSSYSKNVALNDDVYGGGNISCTEDNYKHLPDGNDAAINDEDYLESDDLDKVDYRSGIYQKDGKKVEPKLVMGRIVLSENISEVVDNFDKTDCDGDTYLKNNKKTIENHLVAVASKEVKVVEPKIVKGRIVLGDSYPYVESKMKKTKHNYLSDSCPKDNDVEMLSEETINDSDNDYGANDDSKKLYSASTSGQTKNKYPLSNANDVMKTALPNIITVPTKQHYLSDSFPKDNDVEMLSQETINDSDNDYGADDDSKKLYPASTSGLTETKYPLSYANDVKTALTVTSIPLDSQAKHVIKRTVLENVTTVPLKMRKPTEQELANMSVSQIKQIIEYIKAKKKRKKEALKQYLKSNNFVKDTALEKQKQALQAKNDKEIAAIEKHIKQFESYNIKAILLTKEEQLERIRARKEARNYNSSRLKCHLCYRSFLLKITLENHMERHNPSQGAFACDVCHMRYSNQYILTRHISSTHLFEYICNQCGTICKHALEAVNHYKYHQGVTYDCKICGKSYTKPTSLFGHMHLSHGGSVQCSICNETFIGEFGLKAHINLSHKEAKGAVCDVCKIQFSCVTALQRHLAAGDHLVRPCVVCGEGFLTEELLQQHKLDEHKTSFQCDICGNRYDSLRRLKLHMRQHGRHEVSTETSIGDKNEKKKYRIREDQKGVCICEVCGVTIEHKYNFMRHVNTHTKPYRCDLCDQRFAVKTAFEVHQSRVHGMKMKEPSGRGRKKSNQPPAVFPCRYCDKKFSIKMNRGRHEDGIHHKLRPFACDLCGRKFAQKVVLQMHVKTKHLGMPWPKKRDRKPRRKQVQTDTQDHAEDAALQEDGVMDGLQD